MNNKDKRVLQIKLVDGNSESFVYDCANSTEHGDSIHYYLEEKIVLKYILPAFSHYNGHFLEERKNETKVIPLSSVLLVRDWDYDAYRLF
ncbi:hypothetical protein [Cognatishimia sp.]|uniref:hypothetical protein n=1 Tax=Cognatishimia sp. TaxID=2211648 RepID=UPI0035156C33|nr:hypothetical protein [Cognatishimia sp.]NQY58549.1 hypothetical protein [Cognatishimia sp.]